MTIEKPTVIVMVSSELVEQLKDWSEPVRLKIVHRPGMIPAHEILVSLFRVEACPYDCGHTDFPVHGPEDETRYVDSFSNNAREKADKLITEAIEALQ